MGAPRLTLLVAGLCLLAVAHRGAAQRLTPDTSARRAAIADLKPGQPIRWTAAPGGRLQGYMLHLDGQELRIQAAEGLQSVPLAAVDSMWVRRGSGDSGFVAGWLITSAGLAVAAYAACASSTDGNCGPREMAGIAGVSALVGLIGGAIGSAIGRAGDPWQLRIP